MATQPDKSARRTMVGEKRGGYGSSSKEVGKLTAPPRGPAPGASTATSKVAGRK
jgi:hypothetical protein